MIRESTRAKSPAGGVCRVNLVAHTGYDVGTVRRLQQVAVVLPLVVDAMRGGKFRQPRLRNQQPSRFEP
ncbi:hypothetical protein AOC05_01230 [Arthrobacter alpinus]|uniref:Uncharacterized protein n=1 Tax=Arthrobacter alpinus TaxID=656366 RepID=A0A0M5LWX4_9MICC|nr:hypothetical protein AOC05_01230 [Arthrobacter alpinus]